MNNSASSSTSQRLCTQIRPEYKAQAEKTASQVQEIIVGIPAVTPSKSAPGLLLQQDLKPDEFFAKAQTLY